MIVIHHRNDAVGVTVDLINILMTTRALHLAVGTVDIAAAAGAVFLDPDQDHRAIVADGDEDHQLTVIQTPMITIGTVHDLTVVVSQGHTAADGQDRLRCLTVRGHRAVLIRAIAADLVVEHIGEKVHDDALVQSGEPSRHLILVVQQKQSQLCHQFKPNLVQWRKI